MAEETIRMAIWQGFAAGSMVGGFTVFVACLYFARKILNRISAEYLKELHKIRSRQW